MSHAPSPVQNRAVFPNACDKFRHRLQIFLYKVRHRLACGIVMDVWQINGGLGEDGSEPYRDDRSGKSAI